MWCTNEVIWIALAMWLPGGRHSPWCGALMNLFGSPQCGALMYTSVCSSSMWCTDKDFWLAALDVVHQWGHLNCPCNVAPRRKCGAPMNMFGPLQCCALLKTSGWSTSMWCTNKYICLVPLNVVHQWIHLFGPPQCGAPMNTSGWSPYMWCTNLYICLFLLNVVHQWIHLFVPPQCGAPMKKSN